MSPGQLEGVLRLGGLIACVAVAVPMTNAELRALVSPWVAVPMLAFVACYWWLTKPGQPSQPSAQVMAVALAGCGMATHLLAAGYGFTGVLPVVATAVAAFVMHGRALVALIAAQTLVLMVPLSGADWSATIPQGLTFLGFQMFAVGLVTLMERETRSRESLSRVHADLERAHAELRAANARLAESSRAEERLRIARDLHDLVGHQLTALAVNLEVAGHLAAQGPAAEQVELSRTIAKDLLRDVRRAVGQLREPPPVDLPAALRTIGAGVPAPKVHIAVPDDLAVPDAERTEALLRCVQEIITNAVRHSASANVWIEVSRDAHGLATVTARDDGRGVADVVPGNGLVGMAERLRRLGGDLTYDSALGDGFRVRARLPTAA